MSSPALIDQPIQQPEAITPTAPSIQPPTDSNDGRTHTITVQRVPHCVWKFVRENAKQSCLPFRYYLIRLFAASTPIQPVTASTEPPPPDDQTTHTISVSRVPYRVWAHVRHNAMLSQRTFSNYLIEVIEQSSPMPISLGTAEQS